MLKCSSTPVTTEKNGPLMIDFFQSLEDDIVKYLERYDREPKVDIYLIYYGNFYYVPFPPSTHSMNHDAIRDHMDNLRDMATHMNRCVPEKQVFKKRSTVIEKKQIKSVHLQGDQHVWSYYCLNTLQNNQLLILSQLQTATFHSPSFDTYMQKVISKIDIWMK
mmetsp:Transcript_8652/g.12774  ORF Transcript_8652/g.12774 Transcript_8652/m.12774 type:complete len:163 (-) Transcript_8652:449-937(-)